MQTLPACRVHPLQVDEGCTAAHAVTETMLNPTTHGAAENGLTRESLGFMDHPLSQNNPLQ